MLVLTVLGKFVLAPWIVELRAAGLTENSRFALAHGLASGVFVVESVLGLLLVATGRAQGE
jgi:Tfp pilus assembly protein PilN